VSEKYAFIDAECAYDPRRAFPPCDRADVPVAGSIKVRFL